MKTFVILGMHRSATSLVAKGLASQLSMGSDLLGASPSNPHGHFENRRFIALNDAILQSAGGTWDQPPSDAHINSQEVRSKYSGVIEALVREEGGTKELWGWKDPRTTLTIKLYLPYLENPHFVACVRDPHEVAHSLEKRNGMPLRDGLQLAKVYNDRLLAFLAEWTNR